MESFQVLSGPDNREVFEVRETLLKDTTRGTDEALVEIYRRMRPGRSAHAGEHQGPAGEHLLQPPPLRPLQGRPAEDEQEAGHGDPPGGAGPPQGGHHRGHPLPPQSEARRRPGGRHRSPGQPPRARRRRAPGGPVPHRAGPHGAGGPRADEHSGAGDPHAPRPGERQAGHGGPQGVLRLLAALPVHGPDQPAGRADPQAAALGPGTGRPQPRAGGLRGARRAPHPLRPDVPHRDAGRPEHRPDRLALDLRPGQRLRLHRDALPQGAGRPGHRRDRVPDGRRGGAAHRRPGQRRAGRPEPVRHASGSRPAWPATPSW